MGFLFIKPILKIARGVIYELILMPYEILEIY